MTIKGDFQESSQDQLRVTTSEANAVNIAKADVLEITATQSDSLENGVLWGLGTGALGALAFSKMGGAAGVFFILPAIVGPWLDWSHQEHEVIYQIAP